MSKKFLQYGVKSGQVVKMINSLRRELISVVIPCFNGGILLKRSLNSVINQSWENKEIILVDDGSTDKVTLEIIERYKHLPKINIIKQKNKGLPNARNRGGKFAKGEYLYFLDSDDWIELDALENMYYFLKNNNEASYIFSDIVLEGEVNKIMKKEYNFFEQLFLNQIPYSIFIRKNIWNKYGGYDEDMILGYEDWEFNIRLGFYERFGKRLAKPLFHYNVSSSGMLLSKTSKNHCKIWKYIISKNKSLFRFKSIFILWTKWRKKKSNYPLIFFFGWYFFFRFFPEIYASKIFMNLRNFKWIFTR